MFVIFSLSLSILLLHLGKEFWDWLYLYQFLFVLGRIFLAAWAGVSLLAFIAKFFVSPVCLSFRVGG